MQSSFRCGYVAIIGRPNVGKSTLLNQLVGQKISITTRKPQTTRHRILGIQTTETYQIIYVDTPGLHQKTNQQALNRYMNRAAQGAVLEADVIVFVIDGLQWRRDDAWILEKLQDLQTPVILVVNKVDKISDKSSLLPWLQELGQKRNFAAIVPLSAKDSTAVNRLEKMLVEYLPVAAAGFPEDQVTDRSERFLAAELIREKLMRQLGQELPYALTVDIEQFQKVGGILRISAVIYVQKASQKMIVIGEEGARLKQVGTAARLEMQRCFESKVFLQLWVKVKGGWSDDDRSLQRLGYSL